MSKTRQWVVFTAVAVVVVLVAGWFLLVKPKRSHAADLRTQAATQQQNNQVLESQIAALENEQKNLPEQQALLQKFSTRVPDNPAEPTMIRQLSAAAKGAGVDLVSMTPGTAAPVVAAATAGAAPSATASSAGQLVALPVDIAITGSFPNVESFFMSLEKLPRSLKVTGWTVTPVQGSGSSTVTTGKSLPPDALSGTLSAVVYYAPATAPAPTTTTPGVTTPSTAASAAASPAPTASATTPAS